VKKPCCPNPECPSRKAGEKATVAPHGFYKTRSGRRRRYRCCACRLTFGSTRGTAYYRLQHRRELFDEVANLSVEGVNKSAISRVKGIAWNTVHRWLERAGEAADDSMTRTWLVTNCRSFRPMRLERLLEASRTWSGSLQG